MSKYTTQLCYYLATLAGEETISNYDYILKNSIDKVFDFEYPIFNAAYKEELEMKILLHYYNREIGFETVGLWKMKLQQKMNEIMPYYNRLYKALETDFNLLYNQDRYIERENTGNSSNESENKTIISETTETSGTATQSGTNENINKFSDTPQGGLDGVIDTDYLTTATIDNNTNTETTSNKASGETNATNTVTGTGNSTINNTETVHEYGTNDMYAGFEKYSEKLFNIDLRVINELSDLFMKIY